MAQFIAPDSPTPPDAGTAELPWQRTRLRVPRIDQSVFAVPGLAEAAAAIPRNHGNLTSDESRIQGRSLSDLRGWTRSTLFPMAVDYTSRMSGQLIREGQHPNWIVDGHQPSLFHPGVWAKNFGLGALARNFKSPATRLHLIIDTDTCSSRRIRIPSGSVAHPQIVTEPFDADSASCPWEEASIADRQVLQTFADRVLARMSDWKIQPLIATAWDSGLDFGADSGDLVDVLSAVRHRTERSWGLDNLELRMSEVCQTQPFLWFACHLFANHEEFRARHNELLEAYRLVNRVRSQTHPVPELIIHDDWCESPFWVWMDGQSRRQRLFVRSCSSGVELADEERILGSLPLAAGDDATQAVIGLQELQRRGLKIRSRALTTTMFSRIFIGDLFVHGIGGSKYDEMTDRLITSFYGITAPDFLTLSATLQLPVDNVPEKTDADLQAIGHQLRDLDQNPQRHLSSEPGNGAQIDSELAQLVNEKELLIGEQHSAEEAHQVGIEPSGQSMGSYQRYRRLRELNRQMSTSLEPLRARLVEDAEELRQQVDAANLLRDREYSFCLHPEDSIREFMLRIMNGQW